MFIVKRTAELNQTYDLHKLKFNQWPKEAQDAARDFLIRVSLDRIKFEQSKGKESFKNWIADRIIAVQNFNPNEL